MCEDNVSVIINAKELSSSLVKKHITLACHFHREKHVENIVDIRKIHVKSDLSDALIKALSSESFYMYF